MNEKEKFSSIALAAMVICSLQSPTLFMSYISAKAGTDSWIMSILGGVLFLPVLGMWIALANKFPGKTIIEIMEIVFGKVVGKILSAYYIFYYFFVAFANADVVGDFIIGNVMPETPKAAVLVLFIILCCYTVRKGAGTIAKCGAIFGIVVMLVVLINSILLIDKMRFTNFLPLMQGEPYKYYQATLTSINIPFGEMMILFMFLPQHKNPKNVKKALLWGTLIGAVFAISILLRDVAVLGSTVSYVANPAYEAVRLINIANVLTRMEIIYASILIMLLFYKVSICLYAALKGLQQVIGLTSYKPLAFPLGGLAICAGMAAFGTSIEQAFWGANYAGYFAAINVIILPLIMTITAAVRGFKKPKEATAA